jgi:hypothetical protein
MTGETRGVTHQVRRLDTTSKVVGERTHDVLRTSRVQMDGADRHLEQAVAPDLHP